MNTTLRNVLAVLAGLVVGSCLNMGFILVGGKIVPPPLGADTTTMEGLKASIHLFTPVHFLVPFLAHAVGTLGGSATAAWLAASRRTPIAFTIGGAFFLGGLASCFMIPAPGWFMALDLVGAYLPMAWLGRKLAPR